MARPTTTSAEAIEDVALDLFLERGYAAVTAADVARACGISRPTLFRHVAGIDALVLGPVARFGDLAVARLDAADEPDVWLRLCEAFLDARASVDPASTIGRAFRVLAADDEIRGGAMVMARHWREALAASLCRAGVRDEVEAEALAGAAVGIITAAFARGWGDADTRAAFAALRRA